MGALTTHDACLHSTRADELMRERRDVEVPGGEEQRVVGLLAVGLEDEPLLEGRERVQQRAHRVRASAKEEKDGGSSRGTEPNRVGGSWSMGEKRMRAMARSTCAAMASRCRSTLAR